MRNAELQREGTGDTLPVPGRDGERPGPVARIDLDEEPQRALVQRQAQVDVAVAEVPLPEVLGQVTEPQLWPVDRLDGSRQGEGEVVDRLGPGSASSSRAGRR